jgi:hypothetical protein
MITNKNILLGLPGLYQNWLLFALDKFSSTKLEINHNFLTYQHSAEWIKKMDLDLKTVPELSKDHNIINCCVDDQNFVWYLYNFLEKTDGIGISVDYLTNDLFSKSSGTIAFDGLLNHIIKNYELTQEHTDVYKRNAIIENFYLLLIDQDCRFKRQTRYKHPNLINIEFRNFENQKFLVDKLSSVTGFDQSHFESSYTQLVSRNAKYISKPKIFLSKLDSPDNYFDVLETAYLGWLVWKLYPEQQDWFNISVREKLLKNNWTDLCNLANMYYNNTNDQI